MLIKSELAHFFGANTSQFQHMVVSFFLTLNPFPNGKFFTLFQTERVCRRQFQIDENSRKLSKRAENTVGKGEIARYEQFLLFPLCFQKTCTAETYSAVKTKAFCKRVKVLN